jgi:hypothetical protein
VSRTPILLGTISLLLAAPFFLFPTIPLTDLPNHIARLHILMGEAPGAEAYYAVHWRLLPNLALEGLVFLLHPVMPVGLAVRVFLAIAATQLFLGAVALRHAVAGDERGLVLAAPIFVFCGPLLMGFAGECFSAGMALWALALWLRWRGSAARQTALALVASVILLAHLFGFAVYAVAVATSAAGDVARRRSTFAAALGDTAHLAVPAALLLAAPAGPWTAPQWTPLAAKAATLEWAVGLFDPVLDAGVLAAVLLGLLALAPRVTLAPALRAPVAGLTLAWLALPHKWGDATFIDARLPPVIMLLLASGLSWRRTDEPWRRKFEHAALGLFALRLVALVASWASWQTIYAPIRASFALLPQGARLIELGAGPDIDTPLEHAAAYAVARRGALIPTMFAGGPHDLLSYRAPYASLHEAPTLAAAGDFDYFLLIDPARIDAKTLPPFEIIARGADFSLTRKTR